MEELISEIFINIHFFFKNYPLFETFQELPKPVKFLPVRGLLSAKKYRPNAIWNRQKFYKFRATAETTCPWPKQLCKKVGSSAIAEAACYWTK